MSDQGDAQIIDQPVDINGLSRNAQLAGLACWDDVRGATFTVVGLGKSGVAAANALVQRGAQVLVVDDAPADKLGAFLGELDRRVEVSVGGGPAGRRGDLFVMSPGIMPHSRRFAEVKALACAILGEVELFYRLDRASVGGRGHPMVCISGTDGKTTTTLWTSHLLQKAGFEVAIGGNIGDPLCGFLGKLSDRAVVVAEVSAFQLYTCSLLRPRAAVVTNIALDHMDWFQNDLTAYVRTKCKVGDNMGPGDLLLINGDDAELIHEREKLSAGVAFAWQPFSVQGVLDRGLGFDGQTLWWSHSQDAKVELVRADELGIEGDFPITGVHNVENALGASGLALALGAPLAVIRQGLRDFSLPSHRIQPVGQIGGVRFIDDSKATNPHAAIAGLRALQPTDGGKLVWIGGGSEKDADFGELGDVVGQIASAAILIGQTAERIAACLPPELPVHRAATLEECIPLGLQLAGEKGVVLLSPACASFGMFRNYSHRGDVFREATQALVKAMGQRKPG
jgi:UDP-N-acetylmuramoylalanine--D-glutamate ligase